jgi:hypothetical protein
MVVEIVSIDQSFVLDGSGETHSYANIKLPSGDVVKIEIDEDVIQRLAASAGIEEPKRNGHSVTSPQQEVDTDLNSIFSEEEPRKIEWAELAPAILHPQIKEAFVKLGLPMELTEEEIKFYADKVIEGVEAEQQTPVVQEPPAVPQVQYVQDASVVRRVPPRKQVPKDEMGYPVVPKRAGEVDPGEQIATDDLDDDGVSSV